MTKGNLIRLAAGIFMSLFLAFFCAVCCASTASALEYIENGFGSNSDEEQVKSFAAAYGWDETLFLKKEWGGADGKAYKRQAGYQTQALSDNYTAVSSQLLSEDELEYNGKTSTYKKITEGFLAANHIDKGIDNANVAISGGKGGNAVAAVAASQIGVVEEPPYSNQVEYNAYFGGSGQEWCAYFVSWCAAKCGYTSQTLSPTGSTGIMYDDLINSKGYRSFLITQTNVYGGSYTPYPGDIVLYTSNGQRSGTEHCGIVLSASGNSITVVEGNTSGGGKIRGNEGVTTRTLTSDYCNSSGLPAFGRYIVIVHVEWGGADYEEYYDYIRQKTSLNSAASYAMYACLENLSGFNATKRDSSTGKFGIAQWDADGVKRLKDWCKTNARSYIDIKAQIDFLLYDIYKTKQYVADTWKDTADSENGAYNAVGVLNRYFGMDDEAKTQVSNMARQYWLIASKISQ